MIRVYLAIDEPGIAVEVKVDAPYSPDLLTDIGNRATELVIQQRVAGVLAGGEQD